MHQSSVDSQLESASGNYYLDTLFEMSWFPSKVSEILWWCFGKIKEEEEEEEEDYKYVLLVWKLEQTGSNFPPNTRLLNYLSIQGA